jgi:general secretion pathway protein M
MQKLKDWFYGRQPRERLIIASGVVLLLLTIVFLFGLAPFYNAVGTRAERVAKKESDLAWMRSIAGEVISLGGSSPMRAQTGESLVVIVDRAARECGLSSALTGQTPTGDSGIRVRLEQAEFDKIVVCLANLQQMYAVSIESGTFDRAGKPGLVNASLVLNRAGG